MRPQKSINKWLKKGGQGTKELGNNLLAHQDLDDGAAAVLVFEPSNPFHPVTADLGRDRDTVCVDQPTNPPPFSFSFFFGGGFFWGGVA